MWSCDLMYYYAGLSLGRLHLPNECKQSCSAAFQASNSENSQLSFHWDCKGLCFHCIWSHAGFCGLKLMPCGLRKAKHMPDWWGRGMCHVFPKISNRNWNIRANICSKTITNCWGFFYSSMYASLKHLQCLTKGLLCYWMLTVLYRWEIKGNSKVCFQVLPHSCWVCAQLSWVRWGVGSSGLLAVIWMWLEELCLD